jgi:hypothetical protein
MSQVHLTIDRLVLKGIDPADAPALVNALKAELARSLSHPASGIEQASSREVARVRAAAPAIGRGRAGARSLGVAAARTISREIGR